MYDGSGTFVSSHFEDSQFVYFWSDYIPLNYTAPLQREKVFAQAIVTIMVILFLLWRLSRHASPLALARNSKTTPPPNWELLLYLLVPPSDCDPVVGDLEERYRKVVKRIGKERADIYYAEQVLISIWPLLRAGLRRIGSSAVVGVVGFVLRVFGMGSIAEEMKRVRARK
jgi:hypothetical protein